jgi:hypothetical protein
MFDAAASALVGGRGIRPRSVKSPVRVVPLPELYVGPPDDPLLISIAADPSAPKVRGDVCMHPLRWRYQRRVWTASWWRVAEADEQGRDAA